MRSKGAKTEDTEMRTEQELETQFIEIMATVDDFGLCERYLIETCIEASIDGHTLLALRLLGIVNHPAFYKMRQEVRKRYKRSTKYSKLMSIVYHPDFVKVRDAAED